MALGQALDVAGGATDPALASRLKGGSYTVEGPLLMGASLAGGERGVAEALTAYGRPLGLAFQLLDDERDGEATLAEDRVPGLVAQARSGLAVPGLDPEAVRMLLALADLVERG
jgi:hypothetical protein